LLRREKREKEIPKEGKEGPLNVSQKLGPPGVIRIEGRKRGRVGKKGYLTTRGEGRSSRGALVRGGLIGWMVGVFMERIDQEVWCP